MAEALYAHALTTQARVKEKLGITAAGFDTVLLRLINSATDWIENACGERRFKSTTYTNEVYSVNASGQKFLCLKQAGVSSLASLSYRAGTPSSPNWTAFSSDEYELVGDGSAGLVRVYGGLSAGTNTVRATYTAGYLINWSSAGDASTHTLPADVSEFCDRLVIKAFKRRETAGKSSESYEGSNVTWASSLDDEDKAVIDRYRRIPPFT